MFVAAGFITHVNGLKVRRQSKTIVSLVLCLGKTLRSFNGNKYGYQGSEKNQELGANDYYTHFRGLDVEVGRWKGVDPVYHPHESPYVSMGNNPVMGIDPLGKSTESIHVDKNGKVLRNYKDGDNSVYVHDNGTSSMDVDKAYVKNNGTSAGGKKIGELGKEIDVNEIFTNVLMKNAISTFDMNGYEWFKKVKQDGEWDLKNNKNTIFGIAWAYDLAGDIKDPKMLQHKHTFFQFQDFRFENRFDAADVGNYHAGWTGTHMSILPYIQKVGAGTVEKLKQGFPAMAMPVFFEPLILNSDTYGDVKADYYWNTKGISDAESRLFNH